MSGSTPSTPASSWLERRLGRFSLSGKVGLMGTVLLALSLMLAALLMGLHWQALERAEREQLGVDAARPMIGLIDAVQRHRGQRSRWLNGEQSAVGDVAAMRTLVDQAIAQADAGLGTLVDTLAMREAWAGLKTRWGALREARPSAAEDFAQHSAWIDDAIAFIVLAADRSGLSFHASVDAYYLKEVVVFGLPSLIESAGVARGLSAGLAARGQLSSAERVRLGAALARLDARHTALAVALSKAGAVNPQLRATLEARKRALEAAVAALSDALSTHIVDAPTLGIDSARAFSVGTTVVDAGYALWRDSLDSLAAALAEHAGQRSRALLQIGLLVLVLLMFSAVLFRTISRAIGRSAGIISSGAKRFAADDLDQDVRVAGRDEFASIADSLNRMRRALAANREAEQALARENLRIREALDVVNTNMRIADVDGTVVYANRAMLETLRREEANIAKTVPGFSAAGFVGSNVGMFYPPEIAASKVAYLAALNAPERFELEIGGRLYAMTVSPVIGENGERVGTVAEWHDRTAEVAAEREVTGLVEAAGDGDFSRRIALAGKHGFFRQTAEGINRLMGVMSAAIEDVARVLAAVAGGDLSQKIEAEYLGTIGELKDSVNKTVEQLREVVGQIQRSTDVISAAAGEIATGNNDLSIRTETQAISLGRTASSLEELSVTVAHNADSAREASELAASSNAVAEAGGDKMVRVVGTMGDIQAAARRIGDIIAVIDAIAFQTNILALNAAVEAARAGDQGRGFAVVASEVRGLAQRSAQAAREIKTLITESVEKVEGGVALVSDAGQTMEEVVSNSQRLRALVNDISQATREQRSGIEEVARAVSEMDQITQQNAALVEEAAAGTEGLASQAEELRQQVALFRLADGGAAQAEIDALDVDAVIGTHLRWRQRLSAYLKGVGETLDAEEVGCDSACTLGRWIYGPGARLGRDAEIERLRAVHARFQVCAQDVVERHQAGDSAGAQRVLDSAFAVLAEEVVKCLRSFKSQGGEAGRKFVRVA